MQSGEWLSGVEREQGRVLSERRAQLKNVVDLPERKARDEWQRAAARLYLEKAISFDEMLKRCHVVRITEWHNRPKRKTAAAR